MIVACLTDLETLGCIFLLVHIGAEIGKAYPLGQSTFLKFVTVLLHLVVLYDITMLRL
jgi:hypothetical protein